MDSEAKYYVDLIGRLLATGDYDWAEKTLTGIANTICTTGQMTGKQRAAIEHVMVGRLKHDVGR